MGIFTGRTEIGRLVNSNRYSAFIYRNLLDNHTCIRKEICSKIARLSEKVKIYDLDGKELHKKHEKLKSLNSFLLEIINSVADGIIVYTKAGTIELINTIASRILNLSDGSNIIKEFKEKNKKVFQKYLETEYTFQIWIPQRIFLILFSY